MAKLKTQVVFPEELLIELDQLVEKRQRSDFIVEAVEEKLQKLNLKKAWEEAGGIWKNRKQFQTDAQVKTYLKTLGSKNDRREKRLKKAWSDA